MEGFRYRAIDPQGRPVSGIIDADTPRQARSLLRSQGLLPSKVESVRAPGSPGRSRVRGIAPAELALTTRQLGALLASGLTLEQTLVALIEESPNEKTRHVLSGLKSEISAGHSLATAMDAYTRSFPEFFRALVRAGEESGALPTVLQQLADHLEAREALKQKTGMALLYPALVTLVALAIVAGLVTYVVPQVAQVFQQSHQRLPLLTRALLATSAFLRNAWPWLLMGSLGIAAAARAALQRDLVRLRWHRTLLRLPFVGGLLRAADTARFASTLAILVGGGVPLLTALGSSTRTLGNCALRTAADRAGGRLREGASLAQALAEGRIFPPLLIHLIASGEKSGKLEQMLKRAALLESQSLERRVSIFITLLEPALILCMGGIVLLIVLAILMPIIEINQLVR